MDETQKQMLEELIFSEERKERSFGKSLYFGRFEGNHVQPYPVPTDQEKAQVDAYVAQVGAFLDQHVDPVRNDREATFPEGMIAGLGKLGVLGMTIPQEYGGLGMSQYAYCRVADRIAQRCGATALFVNAHQSIGLKALLLFGTEEQKQRWLPPLARGEQLAAFSLTEPNAGSDASGIETRAIWDAEKRVYRITGKKQWTTNGSIASVLTVMAKTEDDKITAFLVTPDMPGFRVAAAALDKVGMRGSTTSNLEFKDMEVPESNILGPKGGGLKVCLTVLDYGRTTFGATCTGAARECVAMAIKQARERYQFKRPLAGFALVKKKIAMLTALLYAMESTTYLTAGLVDQHTEDFMLESAMLKVFASDSLWHILYETMQIYGGRSFFTDLPLERMMRDARLNMIGEGSNEVMRAFIGIVGMRDVGMQLKGVREAVRHPWEERQNLSQFVGQLWRRMKSSKVKFQSPLLDAEAKNLSASIRHFGTSVSRLLMWHRDNIVEKQLDLDRIATAAMAIYTSIACLSRLDADLQRVGNNEKSLGHDVAIVRFYCMYAFDQVNKNLKALFSPLDSAMEALSDMVTGVAKS